MTRTLEQIISIPLYLTFFPAIGAISHWHMTKGDNNVKRLKRATYKEIKEKMLSIDWTYNPNHKHSLFDYAGQYDLWGRNYFHAGIFRFGDIGYLLTPYGYLMAWRLQYKIKKALPTYTTGKKPYVK
jgi:hypothetical protein